MNKDERAQLLRERMKAVRGYELPPLPKAKPRREEPKRGFHFNPIAPMRMDVGPRYDWVKTGDELPKEELRPLRKERVSPLTRISEQLPMKLPKIEKSAMTHSVL